MIAAIVLAAAMYGPYVASAVRVIDGDTIVADVVLWPDLTQRATIRLAGIDTAELHGPVCGREMAQKAKAFLEAFVAKGPVLITIVAADKYARRDGIVSVGGVDAAAALLAAGLAKKYDGTGKRPDWCSSL